MNGKGSERAIDSMHLSTRRSFIVNGGKAVAGAVLGARTFGASAQIGAGTGEELRSGVKVLNPRARVPLSFIIDDSTCLVNMGHFCMPQFATAWPQREEYKKPWKTWPREIPDSFVRRFGEWCAEHGVKGKYSVVPYPACVGWLDRELPGWSRKELLNSLALVRDLMMPGWDIHPEMITHTRVIDLRTGRPFEEISPATMENSYPQKKKSVDELAQYIAYSLRILKNCGLSCDGITTPGGFGNLVKAELPLAVHQAVRDVFGSELPHYFKYISTGNESTQPILEGVKGLDGDDPRVVVNVPAGTGDWFGGWDGDREPEGHRYANEDATKGRMVELIELNQPAVMFCHWPGLYSNGTEKGFTAFQRVVTALETRYGDRMHWMKVSELARYRAAAELTRIVKNGGGASLHAPFGSGFFTMEIPNECRRDPSIVHAAKTRRLRKVKEKRLLTEGTWWGDQTRTIVCFELPKGESQLLY
ncbi:MAG: hypothetical protein K9N48_06070 [Verrucomicrobia bacterium]|nr:hypothetical protein [Verrucomicrobiota bacterium]MCF7707951.1 hypothetical protein [Verrucomicrobiota bacterium]